MMKTDRIRVVSGVCVVEKRIFLTQRDPRRGDFGFYWEAPGGKVEPGEPSTQALQREFVEETGLSVVPVEHLEDYDFDPPMCAKAVRVSVWRVCIDLALNKPEAREVIGFGWFTLDEALALPLVPSTNALLLSPVGRGLFA